MLQATGQLLADTEVALQEAREITIVWRLQRRPSFRPKRRLRRRLRRRPKRRSTAPDDAAARTSGGNPDGPAGPRPRPVPRPLAVARAPGPTAPSRLDTPRHRRRLPSGASRARAHARARSAFAPAWKPRVLPRARAVIKRLGAPNSHKRVGSRNGAPGSSDPSL